MKVIEQSFYEIDDKRLFQKVELCGRVCYKSEDKITDTSAHNFVKKICTNNHGSVLEHFSFTLKLKEEYYEFLKKQNLPFFEFTNITFPLVSFNLRAFLNFYNVDNEFSLLLPIIKFLSSLYPELFNKPTKKCEDEVLELIEDYSLLTEEERDVHQRISIKLITDRGVTHELVRHRLASFSQESTRYCNYGKDKFGNQITVIKPVEISEELYDIWYKAMQEAEKYYFEMINKGATPQLARSVLPNSLKTEIVVTASIKEWKLIFELRCAMQAHPDIRYIMLKIKSYFIEKGYINENN